MMAWVFEITTGRFFDPAGALAGTGYAGGDCGARPDAINNPADEALVDVGPIPEGDYTFGAPVYNTHLGPVAVPIHLVKLSPSAPAGSEKRGGFFLHLDTVVPGKASEGCIVQPHATINAVIASEDKGLQVVKYRRLKATATGGS
jgi:hypothetical protein